MALVASSPVWRYLYHGQPFTLTLPSNKITLKDSISANPDDNPALFLRPKILHKYPDPTPYRLIDCRTGSLVPEQPCGLTHQISDRQAHMLLKHMQGGIGNLLWRQIFGIPFRAFTLPGTGVAGVAAPATVPIIPTGLPNPGLIDTTRTTWFPVSAMYRLTPKGSHPFGTVQSRVPAVISVPRSMPRAGARHDAVVGGESGQFVGPVAGHVRNVQGVPGVDRQADGDPGQGNYRAGAEGAAGVPCRTAVGGYFADDAAAGEHDPDEGAVRDEDAAAIVDCDTLGVTQGG
jgi:hypothetical protein